MRSIESVIIVKRLPVWSAARGARYLSRYLPGLGLMAAMSAVPIQAKADSTTAIYHGHDLGLPLAEAMAQVQATGSSAADHVNLSVSGSGEQVMFTEVNFDTIETETTAFRNLVFEDVDVRKIGQTDGRYGITLRAAPGSVNDHVVGLGTSNAKAPDRDSALNYMDFWLVDADTNRVRHLADLLATVGARLREQSQEGGGGAAPAEAAAATANAAPRDPGATIAAATFAATAARMAAGHVADVPAEAESDGGPMVKPAPRIPVVAVSVPQDDDDAGPPRTLPKKCLFTQPARPKHAKKHIVPSDWGPMKEGMTAGHGGISYKISAVHGAQDHQAVEFFLTNMMKIPATVVARVILTASDGTQQAEDLGLDDVPAHSTNTDPSLTLSPFDENTCITDVDVTEVHACPLPDNNDTGGDTVDIYKCGADAAAGTVVVNGITYVRGREPKMLSISDATPPAQAGKIGK